MTVSNADCVRSGRDERRSANTEPREPRSTRHRTPASRWYERCKTRRPMVASSRSQHDRVPSLAVDTRGDAAVEYVLLFGLVALPAIPAFVAAGAALVRTFEVLRNLSLLPVP